MAKIKFVEIDLDEVDLSPELRQLLEDVIPAEPIDWDKVLTQENIDQALVIAGLVSVN